MFRIFGIYIGILFLLLPAINTNELKGLTENFFENLEVHLKANPKDESILFTDQQVENFVDLIKNRQSSEDGVQHHRKKRQIVEAKPNKNFDINILDAVTPIGKIPAKSPKDLRLFQQFDNKTWYAAALQNDDKLKIYKLIGNEFHQLHQRKVHSAVRIALFTTTKGTFVIAAENTTNNEFHDKTALYRFALNENLEKLQNLDTQYATDVAFWTDKSDIFMVIVQQLRESHPQLENHTNQLICETQSIIYKWLGGHFDIVQHLNTSCAVKVTPFTIGKSRFLAVANQGADDKSSDTFSEIFKYDLAQEQFVSYQKIATRGASDIKFFGFKSLEGQDRTQDSFIVIANTYSKDENNVIDYNIKSIVYKYVEGYFLPFQSFNLDGVTEWLPVIGTKDELVLLAASKFEGLKTYQYNGWKFQPTPNQYTHSSFTPGITSLHTTIFNNKPIILISNPDANENNIFELSFQLENQVDTKFNSLLRWCRSTINTIQNLNNQPSKTNQTEESFQTKRHTNTHGLRSVEEDLSSDQNQENNLAFFELQLETQKQQMTIIENTLKGSGQNILIIPGDILVGNLIINNEVLFSELVTETINDINIIAFYRGIIPIDHHKEVIINRMEFNQELTIENFVNLKTINGRPTEDLLHKNVQDLIVNDLIIEGNLWLNDLQVKGLLNGLMFNTSKVLLVKDDQFFLGDLTIDSLTANNITSKFLNNLNLHSLVNSDKNLNPIKIYEVNTLKVKQLTIAGYLNNVDLPTLDKHALKTTGNQNITGNFMFDQLKLNNFQTNNLNTHKIPEDLVRISQGQHFIHQDVQFDHTLQTENLIIADTINNIQVLENGQLDVLRTNSKQMQFVDGDKTIEQVELLQPIGLQGKITSESMQTLNPVTKINDQLELLGDYKLTGKVTIEELLSSKDLTTEHYSLNNLQHKGLKLTESQIPVHLNFAQQLHTDEIFIDTINGVDTHQWVVNGRSEPQYIKGWKTFQGDLVITGDTNCHTVNNIPLPQLADSVLRVDGDQIITGKHEFKNIIAGTVTSPKITLQGHAMLEDLLTQNVDQTVGDAFIGQLSIENLKVNNVDFQDKGLFNGVVFKELLQDTLFKGQNAKVVGSKTFDNVTIKTLLSRKSVNMNRIPTLIKRAEAVTGVGSFVELPEDLRVENIKFGRFLNKMSAEDFDKNWLNGNEQQTIAGDQVFDKVVVHGGLMVDSNRINDLSLKRLVEDTVKINEDFEFETVKFDSSLVSLTKIDLLGHIENLDINNIVADGGEEIHTDSLTFKDSVTLLTPTELKATINNFNFTQLCEYSEPKTNEQRKTLILKNNANIMKTPIIRNINGHNLKTLEQTVWFTDTPSNLTDLRANTINFMEDVTVEGFVAGTNLQWLQDNYFSKTTNQTITSNINFQEGLSIKANLISPQANILSINEVRIDEFVRTAILQDWDQTFEEPLLTEALTLNEIQGDYRLNGLNLQTDVMRYDTDNIVTGKITIQDIDTEVLKTDREFKVQNVNLNEWTKHGVLKSGSYKIEGRFVFENETSFEKGIGLTGLLNLKEFTSDKVLLKSKAQTITGHKVFVPTNGNVPIFKDIKLKGLINGVKFTNLVDNAALKISNNTFDNVVDFHTSLTAENIDFEGLYQGVNISQLFNNLTTNAFVENYYENYDKLRDASRLIKKSLTSQANYLTHFRTLQNFQTLIDLIPMRSINGDLHLATLRENNHTFIMDFFKFVADPGVFTIDTTMKEIIFQETITNWSPLEYKFGTYLYIEFEDAQQLSLNLNSNTRLGHVLSNQNQSTYEIIASIPSNGTRKVLPLFLPNVQKTCLLLVHALNNFMDIYCEGEHTMELHQRLQVVSALQVEVVDYPNRLEIHAIEKNVQKIRFERHTKHLKRENYPAVVIWSYDERTELFNEQQRIFTSTPISISGARHNNNEYLAVASGHLVNTMYSGQVDIKKYDPVKKQYMDYQVLRASAPLQVHLSVLPSNELLLYVLKNSPTDMLEVYEYTGIGKFASLGTISTLQYCNAIHPFNYIWQNDKHNIQEHFIIAKCNGAVDIIQSVFKS